MGRVVSNLPNPDPNALYLFIPRCGPRLTKDPDLHAYEYGYVMNVWVSDRYPYVFL